MSFVVGAADYFNQDATYSAPQTWDGDALYKLDFGFAGRYLDLKITFPDFKFFSLSGLDFDLDVLGER